MERYEKYKDSGVEWIGEIPEGWDIKKLKYVANLRSGNNLTSEQIKKDGNYRVYGGNGLRGYYNNFTHEGRFVLIGRQGALCGNIHYAKNKFWATDHAIVATPTSKYELIWFGELLRVMNLNQHSVAAAQPGLSVDSIKKLSIPFPPLSEQTTIANYLDQKTAEIDQLIAQKERLIELYEEEKTAVINSAVTGRILIDNGELKMDNAGKIINYKLSTINYIDSGIDWLGEIPEHWEVKKIKHLLRKKRGALKTGPFGSQIKNSDLNSLGKFKVYTQRNVMDSDYIAGEDRIDDKKFRSLKEFEVMPRDILFTTRGTIGKCSIFPENMETGILHPCLIRIQIDERLVLSSWIINYVSNSSFFIENVKLESNSTIIDVIYGGTLKEVIVPLPPVKEQTAIVQHIETETTRINAKIAKTKKIIALQKEYRTALISEVVTGKVKVTQEIT